MRIFLFLFFRSAVILAQSYTILPVSNTPDCSFRGASIVNDRLGWISGSKGFTGTTKDGGASWNFSQVKNFESFDFRSIYAFSKQKAVIANAGSPAVFLITDDGGVSWKEVYRNEHKDAFIDGLVFWNDKEGMAFGDPIDNRMLLVRTKDGGRTWKEVDEINRPVLNEGEASFAASGTTIRYIGKGKIVIATGGKTSRLWISDDYGYSWNYLATSILQGKASTGIFSFAFKNENEGIIVGGDYRIDTLKTDHIFLTDDCGKTWIKPQSATGGYRSCVEYLDGNILVATGSSGTDISYDAGKNWQMISSNGYNTLGKARKGRLLILAGEKGKLGLLIRKK